MPVLHYGAGVAAVLRTAEIFEKIDCTFVPVDVMTATQTSAISATSSAYSKRS